MNRLNVSFYLEGLHAVLKSTTRFVVFDSCIFSNSELQSILIAAKHINTLWFGLCNLDVTDEFDIKDENFHIEELVLRYWGYDYNRWKNNIDGLWILVNAVANSSLKQSLKTIEIYEYKMGIEYEDKVREIFKRHDLKDVLELNE